MLTATLAGIFLTAPLQVRVTDAASLRQAAAAAKPGTTILLAPGTYQGGIHIQNLHGAPGKTIVIGGADPAKPPTITGGGSALQLSDVSHLEIRDLVIERPLHNGLNIDDGGTPDTPSRHLTLRNITVRQTPSGNNDGIKLSGIDTFLLENCRVERWGGSAVDMVGCHRGLITGSTFKDGGDTGVQCKGGTSNITIRKCRFDNGGQRGVNIGGSTGLPYFRPPLDKMPPNGRYEAKSITVEGCTFIGGSASPVAFVGVDGAIVRFNTIYQPGRWALRILQETKEPGFVPSRNGVFENNLVVFRSDRWASGGVNIGPGTAAETFKFARNFWFCSDNPARSKPSLPTAELSSIIGQDPLFKNAAAGDFTVQPSSPAKNVGAHAFRQ